jgi:putative peptidoglycan lipid II flippase
LSETPSATSRSRSSRGSGAHAVLVASGILLSRLFGVIRVNRFGHYLGQQSDAADAFNAAFRIPNILQNLFGEGAMSASFIPVYAKLLAQGDEEEAGRVAGAIAGLLALMMSVLVLVGVLATPLLIDLITPGFHGAKRELAIRIVRILFPGAGLLVLSAWCLGILNSHRQFFLSYAAPVIWNVAMIATLVAYGRRVDPSRLVIALAWGSVGGTLLQVVVQLPTVFRLVRRLRVSLAIGSEHVRTVLRNLLPVLFSRGVVQISAYVDGMIASLLPTGAVTGLTNAQLLYILPVSLFGMSVSAAELPAMSSALGDAAAVHDQLRRRLDAGLGRIAFFVVPSAVAFVALGDVVAGAILQTGRFTRVDTLYVWGILAGSAVGLLASTLARLYSSTYYALGDPRTPLKFAVVRVALTAGLGYLAAVPLPPALGVDRLWGVAGLTATAGVAGWIEFVLLRGSLNRRIGRTGLAASFVARLWASAAIAALAAWAVKLAVGVRHPIVMGVLVLIPYGVAYFALTAAMRIPQSGEAIRRLRAMLPRFGG